MSEHADPPNTVNETSNSRSKSQEFQVFEDALNTVGPFGLYQIAFTILLQLTMFSFAGNTIFMSFAILQPELNCSIPLTNNSNVCEECSSGFNATTKYFYGIVQEFSLHCKDDYKPNLISSIQLIGTSVGAFVGGHFTDYVGRKSCFVASFIIMAASSTVSLFCPEWVSFAVTRLFTGFGLAAAYIAVLVWGMELTTSKFNLVVNLASFWYFAYITYAYIGYVTANWRTFLWIVNAISVFTLPWFFFFKESARWLVQKQRYLQAEKSLFQMYKWNKVTKTCCAGGKVADQKDDSKTLQELSNEYLSTIPLAATDSGYSILTLFSQKRRCIYSLILMGLMLIAGLNTNIFLYNLDNLSGSPFMNIFIYGIVRLWIPLPLYLLDRYCACFGRRKLFVLALSSILVMCIAMMITLLSPETEARGSTEAVLAQGSAALTSLVWAVAQQYLVEMYPSIIRSIAASGGGLVEGLGGAAGPALTYLSTYWVPLPYFVLGCFCVVYLIGGLFILPETKGKPLNESLKQEKITK